MLRLVKRLLRIAIAFGALALAVWIVGGSSSFQFCVQQEQNHPSDNTFQYYISTLPVTLGIYRDCFGGFVHDSGEEIISIFTIILALSTIFLWFATRDLVERAESTSQQQLRAYVYIFKAEISDIMSDQKLTVKLIMKNFGQTPAYKVTVSLGVQIAPFPLRLKLLRATQKIKNINIGPGGEIPLNLNGDDPAPVEWQSRFTKKTAAVYVYGAIKYRDAFRVKRFTNFRFYKGGATGVSGPELTVIANYNKAN